MNETALVDFREEQQVYERMKPELLKLCEGKFALFKAAQFVGVFDTPEAAYNVGIERFGNVPFLIQPVELEEPVVRFPALDLGLLHAHP